jgi:hypothetical protein
MPEVCVGRKLGGHILFERTYLPLSLPSVGRSLPQEALSLPSRLGHQLCL